MPRSAKRVSLRTHLKAASAQPSAPAPSSRPDNASEAGWEDASDLDHDDDGDVPMLASSSTPRPSKKAEKKHRSVVESKLPTQKHTTSHRQPNLSSSTQPYSRSHARRLRRAEAENPGGKSLTTDFENALAGISGSTASSTPVNPSSRPSVSFAGDLTSTPLPSSSLLTADPELLSRTERKKRNKAALLAQSQIISGSTGFEKIGEGKGRPLKAAQRNREITSNKSRIPAIIANPAFRSNPFEAIRIHASNTLEMVERGKKLGV